jgi:beta-carotene isomerase
MKLLVLLSSLLVAIPCSSFSTTTCCGKHSIQCSRVRLSLDSSASIDIDWATQLTAEAKEIGACASIWGSALFQKNSEVGAEDIVKICDTLDELIPDPDLFVSRQLKLRRRALEIQRYEWLAKLLKTDYDAYVATASFLSPSRIPRMDLPNIQDVLIDKNAIPSDQISDDGAPLVADCELDDIRYKESILDKILLSIFRKLVAKNTGGVTSDQEGINGLLEQGRTFMLQEGQTPEAQHKMVSDTLGGLMTPVLPPFYRIFMTGIVPKLGTDYDGKQIGPWFYAPFLTSFVTPTFFGFLVGPSKPNRRKDGELGGLVVEKCKFLQESGCKGMCLHQCKLPAQQFFQEELGLPLTVSPNFVTQECQWSFGETPLPPKEDPSFPKGCLVGCESRKAIVAMGSKADVCN